jgi:hypothetical protein
MESESSKEHEPNQPTLSSAPMDTDPARQQPDDDLTQFSMRWARQLEESTNSTERAHLHQVAGEMSNLSTRTGGQGAPDFARTWLRRLADDIQGNRLGEPIPSALRDAAQRVVRSEVDHYRDDIEALRQAMANRNEPTEFVRKSPRAAGSLRDLGRILGALRGSGILSLTDPDVVTALIDFDVELRGRSHRTLTSVPDSLRISRDELLQWADSGAGPDFPSLIRHLVVETALGLERVHFPSGTGVSTGGWDGFVRAAVGNEFVPEGLSGWELSVNKKANEKAEDDYAKRLIGPEGSEPSHATYVEVICRPWEKAKSFASQHRTDNRWRDVLAYTVDDIETWLEHAPATTVWLAEKLGRPIAGVQSAEMWWEAWLASTRTPLRSSVVLAGRESQATELRARITAAGITTIGGDLRLDEVKAFVAAALIDPQDGSTTTSPLLLMSDLEQTQRLLSQPGELLVLVPSIAFVHDLPRKFGHSVIVPVLASDGADIVVPPVSAELVSQALESDEVSTSDARSFGSLARRSLLALRRRLAVQPLLYQPGWANPGADIVRRRTLLLNGWNQTRPGDRNAVAELIGQPYQLVEDALRTLASDNGDPMVAIVDERWHLVSPMDTWLLLGSQLSMNDLEAFRQLAVAVLLERDPALELPEEQRWRASIDGTTRRFSGDLRRGVSRSLALLGAVDDVVKISDGRTGGNVAESIVWELLDAANADPTSRSWVAVAPHLTLLAEAAPSALLRGLQIALSTDSPFAKDVFADKERGPFGSPQSSSHIDVAWAIETLVWSTEHFDAAISLLVQLVELDPGGQWANRPGSVLANIFCPWHPNTSANTEQRLATLHRMRRLSPAVAWRLLVSMLPNSAGFQMVHHGPTYRDWKGSEPVVSQADYALNIESVSRALLDDVGSDADRWISLVKELPNLQREFRDEVRVRLTELADTSVLGGSQELVWKELHSLVKRHREHTDTQWALSSDELDLFDRVSDALAPPAGGDRHSWLFENGLVELGDVRLRDGFDAYEEALSARRTAAVADILTEEGIEYVTNFAVDSPLPGQVGAALARAADGEFEERILSVLDSDEVPAADFAFGYFGQRYRHGGWPWLDALIEANSSLSPTVLSRLLRSTWDPSTACERAEALGPSVASDFWKNLSYMGLGEGFRLATVFSERLVAVGRSAAALDLLALYARRGVDEFYAGAIASAFESLMTNPDDAEIGLLSQYDVDVLLKVVALHRRSLGAQRAVRIEWYFLPMLGYKPDAQTLHQTLAENPEFFVDVVAMVFKSDKKTTTEEPSADQRANAENAYRLLQSWATVPATDSTGLILEGLRRWVDRARALLSDRGLAESGDHQIGQVLAAAPSDEDGSWPCEAVRDLLEEVQSDAMDSGLRMRIYNNRGVTSRSLHDGGQQEWDLAADYRSRAEGFSARWPRTASILRSLAAGYESEARREDSRAELRRRGLDH